MSVSIFFQLVQGKELITGGTSFVEGALRATFGEFPIFLTTDHLTIIRAMEKASGEWGRPYGDIASKIEKFGTIVLTAEY